MKRYIGVLFSSETGLIVEVRFFRTHLERYNWTNENEHLRSNFEHLNKTDHAIAESIIKKAGLQ
jgi:hypothetical protein